MPTAPSKTTTGILRPENQLLLCCARTRMEEPRAERVRALLQQELDWNYLFKAALQHGVRPLLYWHLNTVGAKAVPTARFEALRHAYYTNSRYNLFLASELLKLLQLFEEHGITAVPFKGPTLAAAAYGNLSLREFEDLDILVQKHQIPRAIELLITQGYESTMPLPSEQVRLLQSPYYIFVRPDGKVCIDLQWGMRHQSFAFAFDAANLWEHLVPIAYGGTTICTFPPEETLLALCEHGAKHIWGSLKWICDIAEMVSTHEKMDWERVMQQARRTHSERRLLLGLYLAYALLEAKIPDGLRRRAEADTVVQSTAAQVRTWLFAQAGGLPLDFARSVFYLKLTSGWRGRVSHFLYCLRFSMTPIAAERTMLPLPRALSFVYYLFRPLRLMVRYGMNLWK